MALSGKNTSGGFDKSYFVQQGAIKTAEIKYNEPGADPNKLNDIQLELTLIVNKKDGGTYDKKITISGNYKRDEQDSLITGWGTAFKIKALFNTCGLQDWEADDNGVIPESLLKSIIGKEIWFVNYRTSELNDKGERKYSTYKLFGKTAEAIEKQFLKDVSGDYPPYKYEPAPEDSPAADTSFAFGANVPNDMVI